MMIMAAFSYALRYFVTAEDAVEVPKKGYVKGICFCVD